jgi:hypothetical protein
MRIKCKLCDAKEKWKKKKLIIIITDEYNIQTGPTLKCFSHKHEARIGLLKDPNPFLPRC